MKRGIMGFLNFRAVFGGKSAMWLLCDSSAALIVVFLNKRVAVFTVF